MVETELRLKIIADVSQLKSQVSGALGKVGLGGGGGVSASAGVSSVGAGGGAVGIINALAPIAAALGLISAFYEAVGPLIKTVMKVLSGVILILLIPFIQLFMPLLKSGFNLLISLSQIIANTLVALFQAFKLPEAIQALAEGDVAGFFTMLFSGVASGILFLMEKVMLPIYANGIAYIANLLGFKDVTAEKVMEVFRGIISNLADIFSQVVIWMTGPDSLWEKIKGVAETIMTWLNDPWKAISDALGVVVTWMTGDDSVWQKIKKAVESAKTFLTTEFDNLLTKFKDFTKSMNEIVGMLSPIWDKLAGLWNKLTSTKPIFDKNGNRIMNDFIWRAGSGIQEFSSQDNVVGVKDMGLLSGGGGGGVSYSPTYNISGAIDESGFRKMLREHDNEFLSKLRQRTSTGGRYYNA